VADQVATGRLAGQAVENPGAVGESLHKPGLGQQLEVPRHARLALVEDAAQLQHRQLLGRQQGEEAQPGRLPRRAQHFDNLFG
jgi:hypothetical protein